MKPSPDATKRRKHFPALLVVSASDRVVEACRGAAAALGPVVVETSDVGGVASAAARLRPFAIILDETLFEFDPPEFRALARDVGAEIIRVRDTNLPMDRMIVRVGSLLKAVYARSKRG